MIIELENQQIVVGSEIVEACFRTSLEPVPVSFECDIKLSEDYAPYLLEGKVLLVGKYKTPLKIVFVEDKIAPAYQRGVITIRKVIALHANSASIANSLSKAVIREQVSLSEIYRSCGGKSVIEKDFTVPRFYAYKGSVPSREIALVCQEQGGVVRWLPDGNKLSFFRIYDLFNQEPKATKPQMVDTTFKSGLIVSQEVSQYISLDKQGNFISSSTENTRATVFSPNKTQNQLNLMASVLLNAKEMTCDFEPDVNAGDVIELGGVKMVVITAAHFNGMNITNAPVSKSVFWLGVKSV